MIKNDTLSKRICGIDLLKIVSMFMIVVLHVLGKGGILNNAPDGSSQYYIAWFLESAAFCSVNCFALATGYLMSQHKFKYRRIINLWIIVQAYNIVFFVIDVFVFKSAITPTQTNVFLPVLSNEYWYLTAYFCLFFFIPFLNKLIDSLNKKQYYILIVTGFLLFCFAYIPLCKDVFELSYGYSAWWLMYLYLVGAGIRKYNIFGKMSCASAFMVHIIFVIITFVLNSISIFTKDAVIESMGINISDIFERMVAYISPTVFISSVFLFVFFLKLKISNAFGKILNCIQPLIFQVYIIHTHYFVLDRLNDRFVDYLKLNPIMMLLMVVIVAFAIFAACLLIDWIRSIIFKILKVNYLIDVVSDKLVLKWQQSKIKNKVIHFFKEHIGV